MLILGKTRQDGLKRRLKSTIQFLLLKHLVLVYTGEKGESKGGHRGGPETGALHTQVILHTAALTENKRYTQVTLLDQGSKPMYRNERLIQ